MPVAIDKPSKYFNTVLYNGNGSTQSITGVGFQPDCTWTKGRTGTYGISNHKIYDSIRGATKTLFINLTNAETTQTDTLTSFNSDGFSLGSDTNINASSTTFVSWNWLASNTSGSSNTSGTITSTVAVNTTSGFSIVTYTGTGANATVGHGLGVAPKMIITKQRGSTSDWGVWHTALAGSEYLLLNSTAAKATGATYWNSTIPTSTVFSVGTATPTNVSSATYVAYCFAPKSGFSSMGSYVGNASTDGPFIYTGFKPAFVLFKNISDGTTSWYILDNKRNTYNIVENVLFPNVSDAETTANNKIDMLSNGFKIRTTGATLNGSGNTIIYMAFADSPIVSSKGIPTTAR